MLLRKELDRSVQLLKQPALLEGIPRVHRVPSGLPTRGRHGPMTGGHGSGGALLFGRPEGTGRARGMPSRSAGGLGWGTDHSTILRKAIDRHYDSFSTKRRNIVKEPSEEKANYLF